MSIDNIQKENDILLWLGPKLEEFKNLINKVFETKNIEFWGTEYDISTYTSWGRVYGGGRVDIMFGNNEMLVPVELKYNASKSGYEQIKKYTRLLKEKSNKEINGILMCVHATKSLKEIDIDDNIMIIEIETGKAW